MVTRTSREWRRVALVTPERRYDLAIPVDDTLDEAVRRLGLSFVPGRHVLLDRSGRESALSMRGIDIDDGSLFAIVEVASGSGSSAQARPGGAARRESAVLWWLLGSVAVLLAALVLSDAGRSLLPDPLVRILVGGAVCLAAAGIALAGVAHRRRDALTGGAALSLLAPFALAFAGGAAAIPPQLEQSAHLAVASGLLAASIVSALVTVALPVARLRSGASAATVVLLVLTGIWGVTLLAGWGMPAAAAISAGLVPLALRALPSLLVDVDEGYHIDYAAFMSSRWTVRGAIPEDPGPVTLPAVRSIVDGAEAGTVVGTVLFSLAPPVLVPLLLPGLASPDALVVGGTIGLLSALVVALVLAPRRTATPALRWAPRAAAGLVVVEVAVALAVAFPPLLLTVAAGGLLVVAFVAAAALVPIARGAASLGWSRLADAFEWLAVVLALPAALLAADGIDVLRGMMAA